MELEWKVIDLSYLDYLRINGDNRIPKADYGKNKYKPFFGNLFSVGDLTYVTQISHAQPRHLKMKESKDFYKLHDNVNDRLLAVVNLNYMFPVPTNLIEKLEYKSIDSLRDFSSHEERSKYIDLMKRELFLLNRKPLIQNAKSIYEQKYLYPDSFMSKRCLDFKSLEIIARMYT